MTEEYVVAIDVGATNIRTAIIEIKRGKLIDKIKERTRVFDGVEHISFQIVNSVRKVLEKCEIPIKKIKGIGVGAPGPLDIRRGGISKAVNIPYEFIPIKEPLEKEYGLPVALKNDANASALGELMFGVGKNMNVKYLVFITISTGIGAGIIDNGILIEGADGNAGEVGCITVDYKGRLRCGCGRYGHWQAYSSGASIPNFVKYLMQEGLINIHENTLFYKMTNALRSISAEAVYELAKKGDQTAIKIVDELAIINAVGIANVINAYNPEVITLGGSIILNNIELTINKIVPKIKEYAVNRIPKIMPTPLGEDVGLYGAAAAIIREVVSN
jgi:glucokinase